MSAPPRNTPFDKRFANICGLPVSIDCCSVDAVLQRVDDTFSADDTMLTTFVNPYSCWVAKHSPEYTSSLNSFDNVLMDGSGMVAAARSGGLPQAQRLSFDSTSLSYPVFDRCQKMGWGVYLIGSTEASIQHAAKSIRQTFPDLRIVGTSPGYFDKPEVVVEELMRREAQVVVCGMGAPKQEDFLLFLRGQGWKGVAFTCGGYFDQLNEGFSYYPVWVDKLNIRFLYRMYREPKRLWRRYMIEYWIFLLRFVTQTVARAWQTFARS